VNGQVVRQHIAKLGSPQEPFSHGQTLARVADTNDLSLGGGQKGVWCPGLVVRRGFVG
jgi:hypothetical protein